MREVVLRVALLWLLWAANASAVVVDWVTIGDPGNACDPQSQGCFGSVAESYRISRTEINNAQYADFLNAVASSDPNGLYSTQMGSVASNGGITRTSTPDGFVYDTIPGREALPVRHVSFYDALRFVNWLHNEQPVGDQNGSTTESGAYTITAQGIADNTITRNLDARVTLSSEDEWYKAAYYDPVSQAYFDYPTASNTASVCSAPTATANRANCNGAAGDLSAGGSYTGSASPYGTFDQGGNIFEWNEAIIGSNRGTRGGDFASGVGFLAAANRNVVVGPAGNIGGFRVTSPAATQPPPVPALGPLAGALLGLAVATWGVRRLRSGRKRT